MIRVALTLALTLSACVRGLPGTSPDGQAIEAVESEWAAVELPDPGDCLRFVEVRRHVSASTFRDRCEGSSPGIPGVREAVANSAGCVTYALKGVAGRQVVVINVAPSYHDDMGLVQHEALHALCKCALGAFDHEHSNPRVWTAAGGPSSVQSRAR